MKNGSILALFLTVMLVLSACAPMIHTLGGYTGDEYGAQATKVAQGESANKKQASEITDLKTQVESLEKDKTKLAGQVDELKAAEMNLAFSMDNYKAMVCGDHTWDQMANDVVVYSISVGNADLMKLEKDTQVSFFLTQWVPLGNPPATTGYYLLIIDFYGGMAMDTQKGCVILNPAKWPGVGK